MVSYSDVAVISGILLIFIASVSAFSRLMSRALMYVARWAAAFAVVQGVIELLNGVPEIDRLIWGLRRLAGGLLLRIKDEL